MEDGGGEERGRGGGPTEYPAVPGGRVCAAGGLLPRRPAAAAAQPHRLGPTVGVPDDPLAAPAGQDESCEGVNHRAHHAAEQRVSRKTQRHLLGHIHSSHCLAVQHERLEQKDSKTPLRQNLSRRASLQRGEHSVRDLENEEKEKSGGGEGDLSCGPSWGPLWLCWLRTGMADCGPLWLYCPPRGGGCGCGCGPL